MLLSYKHCFGNRLRQAANDMYYKALTFKLLWCQPEPVEGGFQS